MTRAALGLEIIQTEGRWFQKKFYRTAVGGILKHRVVAAATIAGSHVRHEDAEDAVALAQQGVDGPLQTIANIRR